MPLSSYLTKALKWLQVGYPAGAPRHGYVPLVALMPRPAAQAEDALNAAESPVLLALFPPGRGPAAA